MLVSYFGLVILQDSDDGSGDGTCCSIHLKFKKKNNKNTHIMEVVYYCKLCLQECTAVLPHLQSYCVGVLQAAVLSLI